MKKFIIALSIIVFIILSQIVMFNRVYCSKEDKQLAQIIENAVNLISKGLVSDYSGEFTVSDVEYVCFARSIYSISVNEVTREVFPEYKYSNYLEARKRFRKGEGSSILMLIKKDSLIPFFLADTDSIRFDIEFLGSNLKEINNPEVCYKPTNKNVTITIKNEKKPELDKWYNKALITIK
jgi:hypothetical protein